MLTNGMGGIDWAGLPLAITVLGATDTEALIDAIVTIKCHKPPEGGEN